MTVHTKLNCTAGDLFFWNTLLECIKYIPWRLPFKGWIMLELRIMLIKRWFNNIWMHLSVFISCSNALLGHRDPQSIANQLNCSEVKKVYNTTTITTTTTTTTTRFGRTNLLLFLTPWGWHHVAEIHSSWYLTWIVFCVMFYCALISAFCWLKFGM